VWKGCHEGCTQSVTGVSVRVDLEEQMCVCRVQLFREMGLESGGFARAVEMDWIGLN
jgi:hypothetical protein